MQVGSEFLHLCQEQVHLLVRGLGASLAVVAVAERPTNTEGVLALTFVPVITYPEAFNRIDPDALTAWLAELWLAETMAHQRETYSDESFSNHQPLNQDASIPASSPSSPSSRDIDVSATTSSATTSANLLEKIPEAQEIPENNTTAIISGGGIELRSALPFSHQDQLVVPLTYQDAMVGILVTARMDRGWSQLEQYDIQRIAQTISSACVLDQRAQWLEQRLHQQSVTYKHLQAQQKDSLADVLHQLRNPLTAIRTFGKLLRKRLQATDRNRAVAESIIRESDRLQELLQQLSASAVLPPALPDGDLSTEALAMLNGETTVHHRDAYPRDAHPQDAYSRDTRHWESPPLLAPPSSFPSSQPSLTGTACSSSFPESSTTNRLTGEPIRLEPITVMDILAPLVMSAQAIAQERNLTLHVTCSDTLPPIWADIKALREVLNNILDNALKYTPSGGDVHIVVGIDGNESMYPGKQGIAIVDTGPGIPSDDQPHLFTRHFRGVQADGNIPGTGLGLAIAQLLVHQMQGDISVFSPVNTCSIPINLTLELPDESEQLPQDQSSYQQSPQEHDQHPGTLFIVWMADHAPTAAIS